MCPSHIPQARRGTSCNKYMVSSSACVGTEHFKVHFLFVLLCTFCLSYRNVYFVPSSITSLSFSDYVFLLIDFYPEISEIIRPFHNWFPEWLSCLSLQTPKKIYTNWK
jgi:hypothetical protein